MFDHFDNMILDGIDTLDKERSKRFFQIGRVDQANVHTDVQSKNDVELVDHVRVVCLQLFGKIQRA